MNFRKTNLRSNKFQHFYDRIIKSPDQVEKAKNMTSDVSEKL